MGTSHYRLYMDTAKGRSLKQEWFIGATYGGQVTPGSGNSVRSPGDVRTARMLIECKQTGQMDKPVKSFSLKLGELEKAFDEATSEGRDMAMAIRIYNPESMLSDRDGMIDLIVRRVADDHHREEVYEMLMEDE